MASSSVAARRQATLKGDDDDERAGTVAQMPSKREEKKPEGSSRSDWKYKDSRKDEARNYRRSNPKWLWACHAVVTLPLTVSLAFMPSLYATAATSLSSSVVGVPGTPGGVVKDLLKTAIVAEHYMTPNVTIAAYIIFALTLVDIVAFGAKHYDEVSNMIATKMAFCIFGGAVSVFEWIRTMHLLFLFTFLYFFLWMYVYLMVIFLDPSAPDEEADEGNENKEEDEDVAQVIKKDGTTELRQRNAGGGHHNDNDDEIVKRLMDDGEQDNECAGSGQGSCCIGQIVITVPSAFVCMKIMSVGMIYLGFTDEEARLGQVLGCIVGATGGCYVSGTMWVEGWDITWSMLPSLFGATIGSYLAMNIRFARTLKVCSAYCQESFLLLGFVPIFAVIAFTVFNILRVSSGKAIPEDDLVFPDDDDVSVLLIAEGAVNRVGRILRLFFWPFLPASMKFAAHQNPANMAAAKKAYAD